MITFGGGDPDLHHTGYAAIDVSEASPSQILDIRVSVIKVSPELKRREAALAMCHAVSARAGAMGVDHLVVEGQKHRREGNAKPDDLIDLATVSGALIASGMIAGMSVSHPRPSEWKGSVPKDIHQARVCTRLGWAYTKTKAYSYPSDPGLRKSLGCANAGPWKHIMDAIGLALWGWDEWRTSQKA